MIVFLGLFKRQIAAICIVCAASTFGQPIPIEVPATSNPWLAGVPDGTTCCEDPTAGDPKADVAPDQSPILVQGLDLTKGGYVVFEVSGAAFYGAGPTSLFSPPDGRRNNDEQFEYGKRPALLGKSGIKAPLVSLLGVFLGQTELTPSLNSLVKDLDYGTLGTKFRYFAPELGQVFYIGDGIGETTSEYRQQWRIPPGASRLYLGIMDGAEWSNNSGSFTVRCEVRPSEGLIELLDRHTFLTLVDKAFTETQQIEDLEVRAEAINKIAEAYISAGYKSDALALLNISDRLCREAAKDRQWIEGEGLLPSYTVDALVHNAKLRHELQSDDEVPDLIDRSLSIAKKAEKPVLYSETLVNLAKMGFIDQSKTLLSEFDRTFTIAHTSRLDLDYVITMTNIAEVYHLSGERDKSLKILSDVTQKIDSYSPTNLIDKNWSKPSMMFVIACEQARFGNYETALNFGEKLQAMGIMMELAKRDFMEGNAKRSRIRHDDAYLFLPSGLDTRPGLPKKLPRVQSAITLAKHCLDYGNRELALKLIKEIDGLLSEDPAIIDDYFFTTSRDSFAEIHALLGDFDRAIYYAINAEYPSSRAEKLAFIAGQIIKEKQHNKTIP